MTEAPDSTRALREARRRAQAENDALRRAIDTLASRANGARRAGVKPRGLREGIIAGAAISGAFLALVVVMAIVGLAQVLSHD